MIIKNFDALAVTPLRKQALLIAEAGLAAIATPHMVAEHFRYNQRTKVLAVRGQKFDTSGYKRIIVVGFGKVALQAVTGIQEQLGERVSCGFVISLEQGSSENLGGNIVCKVGTHPYPSIVNVAATKQLVAMLAEATADDLVICVIGGGGSSLLCYPAEMTCDQERDIIAALTAGGAAIEELNTVRKHISQVKGGNLAKICYPATVVSLVFSDVPGDDLGTVASGPTVKDQTTVHDASAILQKYNVLDRCKLPSCELVETPKEDKYFERVHNLLFVSAADALAAMEDKADDLGFNVRIWDPAFQGEASDLAQRIIRDVKPGECLLGAGESTVHLDPAKKRGQSGRNQEMALAALPLVKDGEVFVTVASDGHDNSEAAGAIADMETGRLAQQLELSPQTFLDGHDSYNFFIQSNGMLDTGNTGSNVSDFFVCLRN